MDVRFINCEVCQTEGRILTNDGGPDDVDHGACPACNGERVVEVEVRPVTMNDNVSPALQPLLAPIPFEKIGPAPRRAMERDRDNAALALAGCVVGILKFDGDKLRPNHRAALLDRVNKVRRSQGIGDVTFVHDTAERIRAAAEPGFSKGAFDDVEAEIARQMAEPSL